ncbi:hypothetical protein RUM44_005726 [Polyplax serrata]|uniref:Uncharacterized protein n=1 Tax=Polyplax serrata TaxID=468196 RepID=A0ABR1AWF7_POLSC
MSGALQNCRKKSAAEVGERSKNKGSNSKATKVHPAKKEKNEAFTASVPEGMKKNAQEYVTRPDQVESSNCQQNGGQVTPHMIFV